MRPPLSRFGCWRQRKARAIVEDFSLCKWLADGRWATGTGYILPITPGFQNAQTAVERRAGCPCRDPEFAESPLHVVMAARLGLAALHGDADLWSGLVSFRHHKSTNSLWPPGQPSSNTC